MTEPFAGAGPGADDRALVARAAEGQREALELLLRRHYPQVLGLCRRITGDEHDAFDAAQDACIAIARGIGTFDDRSAFTTWLYRVVTNTCLDELRRRRRRPVPVDASEQADLVATGLEATPERAVVDRIVVDGALASLPPEFRAAVALRDLCDLDYATIADLLGIPPGTVRSRIARGRAAVARALGNPDVVLERPTPRP